VAAKSRITTAREMTQEIPRQTRTSSARTHRPSHLLPTNSASPMPNTVETTGARLSVFAGGDCDIGQFSLDDRSATVSTRGRRSPPPAKSIACRRLTAESG
jgi:hypothetical protein